jgi:acyl carrier protein
MSFDTLGELRLIFRDYFDDDDLLIERTTSAKDINEWDSLAQVGLVITIEKKFGMMFSKSELDLLNNIGDMADLIDAKR